MSSGKQSQPDDTMEDYEVVGVSGGRKPGGVVSIRLDPDEMEMLTALAEAGERTLSETLRLGLHCLDQRTSSDSERGAAE